MKIKKLTELSGGEITKLEKLDKNSVKKYGDSFSNEIWKKENFLYALPKKDEYSYIVLLNNKIIGYCIASQKNNAIYIHRFVIDNIEQGLSGKFLTELFKIYKNNEIYLMVNILNKKAIEFYKKHNFTIEENKDIMYRFIDKNLKIDGCKIVINKEYKCYLMKKD
jgi:ribosomal protein S18 acetylase RimI-like enzyme